MLCSRTVVLVRCNGRVAILSLPLLQAMSSRSLLISGLSAMLSLSVAVPAFAYVVSNPLVANKHYRRIETIEDARVIPVAARRYRSSPEWDSSGRSYLSRSRLEIRSGQRNLRRHVLGNVRGMREKTVARYRILNRVANRRTSTASLPRSLVKTGSTSSAAHGEWGYDRPTRRDLVDHAENRDILREMRYGVR